MVRIVSLLPSATEIVSALGAADDLVGISHECDFPEQIRDRPVLTRSRIDVGGSSSAIDRAVRAAEQHALSVYAVDDELLGALSPDLIVTQDLCEVCAVSLDDVRSAVARLTHRTQLEVVSLRPTRLEHVLADVERVAVALGRAADGVALRAEMTRRIRAIARRVPRNGPRPRVVSLEWIDPLMIGGTWMPELIELAGGVAAGACAGQPAPTVTALALAALEPEVVVVKPCGFSLARTLTEREVLERSLAALGSDVRVYITDGNAFFNRPGPRLVESIEIMAACIHPERFEELGVVHDAVIYRLR